MHPFILRPADLCQRRLTGQQWGEHTQHHRRPIAAMLLCHFPPLGSEKQENKVSKNITTKNCDQIAIVKCDRQLLRKAADLIKECFLCHQARRRHSAVILCTHRTVEIAVFRLMPTNIKKLCHYGKNSIKNHIGYNDFCICLY